MLSRFTILLAALTLTACDVGSGIPVGEWGEPGVDHTSSEIIVKYLGDSQISLGSSVGAIGTLPIAMLKNAEVLKFAAGSNLADTLAELRANPLVEYAEPNYIYHHTGVPTDLSASLWALNNNGQTGGAADADIDAVEAWDVTTGSSSVIVAIIDTGVDASHPDLSANIWHNSGEVINGLDDDGNGYIDDVAGWDYYDWDNSPHDFEGHGTHVAGTIGARGNNGGLVGVNWNVKIMPLRFLGPDGGNTYHAVLAIDYAVAHGAKVINISWAGPYYSQALREAISRANDAGVLIVAAAGNEASNLDSYPMYPAAFRAPNVISVAATDSRDRLAGYSNYGTANVDVAAPGSDILSTWTGGGYAYESGTSMATPHVAGVAALALSVNPSLSASDLRDIILQGSDKLSSLSGATASGGRLNAANVVALAAGQSTGNDEPTPDGGPSWQVTDMEFGTSHPYLNATDTTWQFQVPGALYVSLHFTGFLTEGGYDGVYVYDANWNIVGYYDGNLGAFWCDPVPGDLVYFRLVTDGSVQRYGFDMDAYAAWN